MNLDVLIFSAITILGGGLMWAGYMMGKEVGLDQGFQTGFDLGKGVGRREVRRLP